MLKSKGAEIGYLLGSLSLTAYSLSTINMNMQGVHDILHCSKASHTEVVNDLDLLTEDFEQVALDSTMFHVPLHCKEPLLKGNSGVLGVFKVSMLGSDTIDSPANPFTINHIHNFNHSYCLQPNHFPCLSNANRP